VDPPKRTSGRSSGSQRANTKSSPNTKPRSGPLAVNRFGSAPSRVASLTIWWRFTAPSCRGGDDLDPARYGQTPHPRTETVAAARDDYEIAFVRAAIEQELPTLAICRGLQVTNVAFGGTLHQHVPDIFGERIAHRFVVNEKVHRGLLDAHALAIAADSELHAIVGPTLVTGSRHHQAADRVADPFRVVAFSEDGVVEALERRAGTGFSLAVHWHPESTLEPDRGAELAIFVALVRAARKRLSAAQGQI
jgi:putative glutamine amidotransferase